MRGGGRLVRPSVNGLQFVETGILRGSGVLTDPRIGSKRDIHSVLDWTPDDNSEGHPVGGPVTVNFKAENTTRQEIDGATGTFFEDYGTHNQTKSIGTAIELATAAPSVDFEDYVPYSTLVNASNPDNWFRLDQKSDGNTTIRPDPINTDEWSVRGQVYNSALQHRLDDAGTMYAGILTARFYFDGDGYFSLTFQHTGSGTALRGYCAQVASGSQYISFRRMNDWDSFYGVASQTLGIGTIQTGTWYWLKVRFYGTTTTGAQYKCWEDGDSEPENFSWLGSDSAYTREGYVGFHTGHNVTSPLIYMDDFSVEPDPAVYVSSGDWTSDELDVTAVQTLASHRIHFDTTTPENTTAAVKCRWGTGDSWLTCTDGAKLPGCEYRDDMTVGAAKSLLELRIELATTDTGSTPSVDNLRVEFDPCLFEDCKIELDGDPLTIALGTLSKWGREQVSGGSVTEGFLDLYVQGHSRRNYKLRGETILAEFLFDDHLIDDIVFAQLLQAFRIGAANGYFSFSFGAIESVGHLNYTVRNVWFNAGKNYEWVLIDKTQGIHADSWYWVGHAQADDFLGSALVADPEESDFPGSVIVKGYKRDDYLGSALVQGWRHDDFLGSLLVYLQTHYDFPGAAIVAVGHSTDFPGSLVVYGVNRNNEIEIHTVDADTVAELEKLGFVFPPENP
jgi:hypothetical protein